MRKTFAQRQVDAVIAARHRPIPTCTLCGAPSTHVVRIQKARTQGHPDDATPAVDEPRCDRHREAVRA